MNTLVKTRADQLRGKLESKTAKFGIIGLGYVGLPTAMKKLNDGYTVTGFDVSTEKVAKLNNGENYIKDVNDADFASFVESGKFRATTNFDNLVLMDVVLICVPTPIDEHKQPDLSFVKSAGITIGKNITPGTLVILESTTYPGTTEEYIIPPLIEMGHVIGEDVFVAYSPERVDPGNRNFGLDNTPKLVGGMTKECTELACLAIGSMAKAVSHPRIAEMAKAYENAFRFINIGFVNEMAQVCDKLGIDIWEVVEASGTKPFGFMKFLPGPGVGGHCIPVDPYYLTYKAAEVGLSTKFIELAGEVNDSMTGYVVNRIGRMLNKDRKAINGSRVLILGVAYKPNIDDLRESPILPLLTELEELGAEVVVSDPYFSTFKHGGKEWECQMLTEELVRSSDITVVATAHDLFPFEQIAHHAQLILDTRNAVPGNSSYRYEKL